jgi:hypothetical protein
MYYLELQFLRDHEFWIKTQYLNINVTIWFDIPSTANHSTFIIDYKYVDIIFSYIIS